MINLRIYMAWFATKSLHIDITQLPSACRFSKTPHEQFVFIEQELEYEDLKTFFSVFAQQGLRCQSIHIFERGTLPDLTMYGFKALTVGFSFPVDHITVSATPYTDLEWCCMIRGKREIPFRALNYLPYFQQVTSQLSFFEGEKGYNEQSFTTHLSG